MKISISSREVKSKSRRKVLPSLGGITKIYLRKGKIFYSILEFLASILGSLGEKKQLEVEELKMLKKVSNDIQRIAKFERYKKMKFYDLCENIVRKYNK